MLQIFVTNRKGGIEAQTFPTDKQQYPENMTEPDRLSQNSMVPVFWWFRVEQCYEEMHS